MDLTKLQDLTDSQKETLYKEYSIWARHYHILVWTAAAFGVTIQLSTLLLYKDLSPVPYSIVSAGGVFLLLVAYKLAEGNRRQWADYKSVPNTIESVWRLRNDQNLDTQLSIVSHSTVRVEKWRKALYIALATIMLLTVAAKWARGQEPDPAGSWYFAVSGDSRDCGDLVMPKIASDIKRLRATTPVEFYWHLGDFRRLYGPDCDIIKRTHPAWNCKTRPEGTLGTYEMNQYLIGAWDDFIAHQVNPFEPMSVYLGIGNHELAAGRTRYDFRRKFQKWLTAGPIHLQRVKEAAMKPPLYSNEGDTYYHFIKNGVDFISLDNADGASFSAAQLVWLGKVLASDARDLSIKAIVAGMHEALPYSKQRGHAMDATCQGLCSGEEAYTLLYRAKMAGKHVYVFASHSHLFVKDAFDEPEHAGQVLPGWIIGTAGAEQYRKQSDPIEYGYALVTVHPNGVLKVGFQSVGRNAQPLATGPGAAPLTKFCFEQNKHTSGNSAFKESCACGQAQP